MDGELFVLILAVGALLAGIFYVGRLFAKDNLPRYIAVITKEMGPHGNTRSVVNVHHYKGSAARAAEWCRELADLGEVNLAKVRAMTVEWWGNRNGVYIVAEAGHRQEVRQVRAPQNYTDEHYRVPSDSYQVQEGPTLIGASTAHPSTRDLKN